MQHPIYQDVGSLAQIQQNAINITQQKCYPYLNTNMKNQENTLKKMMRNVTTAR